MKASVLLLIFATTFTVNAIRHDPPLIARHAGLVRRSPTTSKRALSKRCQPRVNHDGPPADTHQFSGGGEVIDVQSNCGDPGATAETTATSGPNGKLDWLNCGIESGGWQPPYIQISDLKVKSMWEAVESGNSPFQPCRPFLHLFEVYGGQFGIPPIVLASFALQESSCRPDTVGGGGEQGLMQITRDKCGGAPGGNCRDPDFNIRTGAKFFADLLGSNGGDVLLSIGRYNGWTRGLTIGKATAARWSSCCRCQNNLDYLHQFLNGWLQNIDAYNQNRRLGRYFNLDACN